MTPALEVNGPANIVTHIALCQRLGKPVDLAYVLQQANWTIRYMQAWNAGKTPAWHEVINGGGDGPR